MTLTSTQSRRAHAFLPTCTVHAATGRQRVPASRCLWALCGASSTAWRPPEPTRATHTGTPPPSPAVSTLPQLNTRHVCRSAAAVAAAALAVPHPAGSRRRCGRGRQDTLARSRTTPALAISATVISALTAPPRGRRRRRCGRGRAPPPPGPGRRRRPRPRHRRRRRRHRRRQSRPRRR